MAKFVAYTDGSFDMSTQIGASAVLLMDADRKRVLFERSAARRVEFDPLKKQRNQEQELGAIIRAVMCVPNGSTLRAISDPPYCVKVLSREWNASANLGLIDRFFYECKKRQVRVEFEWVRGHNGTKGNERADELCRIAADSLKKGGPAVFQSDKNLCFEL